MTSKECEQQLKELIEAWDLNEALLNQTDINAIKHLLLENQMLFDTIKKKGIIKTCENCDWFGVCPHSYREHDYKMVIQEVREEIEKSILIEGVRETGVGYYENIKVNKTKLLQILDKATKENKE